MDVEKTIQFILETLADSAAWRADAERRLARTDGQIHGIQTLLKIGARQLIALAAAQKRTNEAIRKMSAETARLTAAQKRTDERFQRWLDRGHNGKR